MGPGRPYAIHNILWCVLHHTHYYIVYCVGAPWGGSEVITIDEKLNRLPTGEIGELVGRSTTMMSGYQNQPEKTAEASWYDEMGGRWQRMGDIGRVDDEGFVTLLGRSKDMIISGGFSIYPRDLEEVLIKQTELVDAAVIGVPSKEWGETMAGRLGGGSSGGSGGRLGLGWRITGGRRLAIVWTTACGLTPRRYWWLPAHWMPSFYASVAGPASL